MHTCMRRCVCCRDNGGMHVCIYVGMCVWMCVGCMYDYGDGRVDAYMHACMYVYMCVCNVCMNVCMYLCT